MNKKFNILFFILFGLLLYVRRRANRKEGRALRAGRGKGWPNDVVGLLLRWMLLFGLTAGERQASVCVGRRSISCCSC